MNYRIHRFQTVSSTNDLALVFAKSEPEEGIVIRAEYQTHGRGRQQAKWISARGDNLLFTILVRPSLHVHEAPLITHVTAVCIKEALERIYPDLAMELKKPNDILIEGKKVCGILVESQTMGTKLEYVAVGIGLNIESSPAELKDQSTSIKSEISQKIEKERVFGRILDLFKEKYRNMDSHSSIWVNSLTEE